MRLKQQLTELRRQLEKLTEQNCRLKALARPWAPADGPRDDCPIERPLTSAATLTVFYQRYFRVARLSDASPRTIEKYDTTLATWAKLTGDPPMGQITVETLLHFREALKASPGKLPGSMRSLNTVRGALTHLQAVLDKAGPAGPRNRDAAGILPGPAPWVKRPRSVEKMPPIIKAETLRAIYAAAGRMTEPCVPDVPAAKWWEALICVVHNTLIRRRTCFELEWGDVDWAGSCLRLPAARLKSARAQVIHLNDSALSALKAIRREHTGFGKRGLPWVRLPVRVLRRVARLARSGRDSPRPSILGCTASGRIRLGSCGKLHPRRPNLHLGTVRSGPPKNTT